MAVDFNGARGLLMRPDARKDIPGCIQCNYHMMKLENRVCPNCPFKSNSKPSAGKKYKSHRCRVYPGQGFRRYGWNFGQKYGKHTFFYFMYYPWMNCQFPEYPDEDLLGNKIAILDSNGVKISGDDTKKFLWHIHHINGNYWDDSPWNLLLCLNTEHGLFEADVKKFNKITDKMVWGRIY